MQEKHKAYISDYLKKFNFSTEEENEFILPHLTIQEYKKKSFYLQAGDVQKELGYVSMGLLRRYYIDHRGSEITTGFVKENEYVTDYPAFLQQRKTKYHIQCLEPSVIILLPFEKIMENYNKFTNGQMYGRLMAEKVLTILTDRLEGFLFNTAEERYLEFIKNNPDLIHRISLTHLSSFLGIERQSLSRIRKRLAEK
ncbi:Crp/Fnr family transcriptional regulator [Flexithrix dorotheae]|uniref:Crp/Fnr family transcriptional regulator n=1 Tax=Flexithrix dorotheae TaxID=70993 RepID=UPI00037D3F5D|nr:Crp/Fnr family transcriptional regulator [Flexithrix dorotheae]